ncbi:hypothetical protein EJ06DRAFT_33765 [Trichodelitschia bisporula]|uniref:Peptidase A2 domain-containing protein n=1 Tax=Trichodelitschia bisporula TaxID=703511 RepID=A0A6G1HUZ8_9PEZI|nr:hypothetical protein EJ06DRAFT_33765 [Trichodelitschia bisporula]
MATPIDISKPIRTTGKISSLQVTDVTPITLEMRSKAIGASFVKANLARRADDLNRAIPLVKANLVLNSLGNEDDMFRLDGVDMLWDTGSQYTMIAREALPLEFLDYLDGEVNAPYRDGTAVQVKAEMMIEMTNTPCHFSALIWVVPKSEIPCGRVNSIFGQRECMDRMHYESVPASILAAQGFDIETDCWGDLNLKAILTSDGEVVAVGGSTVEGVHKPWDYAGTKTYPNWDALQAPPYAPPARALSQHDAMPAHRGEHRSRNSVDGSGYGHGMMHPNPGQQYRIPPEPVRGPFGGPAILPWAGATPGPPALPNIPAPPGGWRVGMPPLPTAPPFLQQDPPQAPPSRPSSGAPQMPTGPPGPGSRSSTPHQIGSEPRHSQRGRSAETGENRSSNGFSFTNAPSQTKASVNRGWGAHSNPFGPFQPRPVAPRAGGQTEGNNNHAASNHTGTAGMNGDSPSGGVFLG